MAHDQSMGKITAGEAGQHFGQVLERVCDGGQHLLIEQNDLPVAVLLSLEEYEVLRMAAARGQNSTPNRPARPREPAMSKQNGHSPAILQEIQPELFGDLGRGQFWM